MNILILRLLIYQSYTQITLPIEIMRPNFENMINLISNNEISNVSNMQYKVQVEIGLPPTKVELIVDTGSSWIWVPERSCKI